MTDTSEGNTTMTGNDFSTTARPSAAMSRLDRLTGSWELSGGTTGTMTYEYFRGTFTGDGTRLGLPGRRRLPLHHAPDRTEPIPIGLT